MTAEERSPEEVKEDIVGIYGRKKIMTPLENAWDNFFLNGLGVSDDFMNEMGD